MTTPSPRMQRRISELEERLSAAEHYRGADTFAAIAARFLDLADDPRLQKLSQAVEAPELVEALDHVLTSMLGRPVSSALPLVMAIPGLGFRHGAVAVDGLPCMFFHFASSGRGLLTYHGVDGVTRTSRFTLVRPPQGDLS